MLPKKHKTKQRILKKLQIKKNKKTYHTNTTTLTLYPQKNKKTFTFVVSKKTTPTAVKRNQLKRKGYAIIEEQKNNIKEGFVFVFYFKKEATQKTYKELKKDITLLLKKANVL